MKDELAKITETKGDSKIEARDQPDSNAHLQGNQKVQTSVDAPAVPGNKTL